MDEMAALFPENLYHHQREDPNFSQTNWLEICFVAEPENRDVVADHLALQRWPTNETPVDALLLTLTGPSYRSFHQDPNPPYDNVATLMANRKLWLFSPRGSRQTSRLVLKGRRWDGWTDLLAAAAQPQPGQHRYDLQYCLQEAGQTVFLPFGWGHSVFTPHLDETPLVTPLLACALKPRTSAKAVQVQRYKKLGQHCAVGKRTKNVLRGVRI